MDQAKPDSLRTGKVANTLTWLRDCWRALAVGVLLCAAIIIYGPASNTDRAISDWLLTIQKRPASQDILLVEFSPADLRKYGRPVMSRENQARLMGKIADGNPQRVMFDLFLAEQLAPAADAELASAFARLGKDRLALVSATGPDDLPDPMFARHATILDARLTPAVDGWHRVIGRTRREQGANPARWLATGESDPAPVPIDIGIDHRQFERVDAAAVMDAKVRLEGRTIIVSPGPEVAPTRAYLPRSESASRAVVIATAAQSMAEGFDLTNASGKWANRTLQLLGALLGLVCAAIASSGRRLVALAAASVVALMVAHVSLAGHMGVAVTPMIALSCFFIMLNATLVRRLRIMSLTANFLRGDLSPEEAWAWRANEDAERPVLLFAADGRIKRANPAAAEIAETFGQKVAELALPRPGQRASEVAIEGPFENWIVFELDWPLPNVPIARLRDVSEARAEQRELIEQLTRDELTGCANRRGLENIMRENSLSGSPYAVFYIDLNGFKQVNDSYGHDVGDELLVKAAKALRAVMRGDATVARLGGDEFAVVVEGSNVAEQSEQIVSRLSDALSEPIHLNSIGREVQIRGAVGYASPRYDGEQPQELLRRADQMMYRRKSEMKRKPRAA